MMFFRSAEPSGIGQETVCVVGSILPSVGEISAGTGNQGSASSSVPEHQQRVCWSCQ